jgi:hypothetical protein
MLRRQPFVPFRLTLLDGRVFRVDYPEALALAPGDRTVIHFEGGQDDSMFTIIELLHVTTLEPLRIPGMTLPKTKRRSRK